MARKKDVYQDMLVMSTKSGSIKISTFGKYTVKDMYQASEHMLVMAGKRYAREKKENGGTHTT